MSTAAPAASKSLPQDNSGPSSSPTSGRAEGYIIETQHKSIPWRWVAIFMFFGVAGMIANFAQQNFVFSLRLFTDSPSLIAIVSSFDIIFNILLGTTCLYLSDRIWTRFGRRLPFILAAKALLSLCFFFIPFADGLWSLIPLIILFYAVADIGQVGSLLGMEIIPPHMRGRAAGMARVVTQMVQLVFALMITSRFDDVLVVDDKTFVGSQLMYWFAAGAFLISTLCTVLFLRERRPGPDAAQALPEASTRRAGFFTPVVQAVTQLVTQRVMWPVYLLAFVVIVAQASEGPFGQLLFTEQWGYSKQDMGTNILVGGLINLLMFPVLGWLVDRFNRVMLMGIAVGSLLALKTSFVVYVVFVLPDHRPDLHEIIFFGYLISLASSLVTICSEPLIWDYVPRNKMGAAAAGLLIVRSLSRLITLNAVGFWVAGYSYLFLPAGTNDYFSSYYMLLMLGLVGVGLFFLFVRQIRGGKIRPVGREGFEPQSASTPAAS